MKKILLALLAVVLMTSVSMAAVNVSGDIQAYFGYNNDITPKQWLGFYRICTFLDMDAMENVTGRIILRPDLYGNGTSRFVDSAFFTVNDFFLPALSAKVGVFTTSFVSYNKNLMTYPETYGLRHRAGAVQLTYDWDAVKLEGALANSGIGILDPGTEGAKSFTLRVSSDKLAAGLFLGAGYKNIATTGLRTGSLSLTGQYKFEQFILNAEYVGQMTGDVKPTDWYAELGYNVMDDLLASVRYEGFKDDAAGKKSILSGGIKYQYRPNLAGIIEVANAAPETGSSSTTFYLGAIYSY